MSSQEKWTPEEYRAYHAKKQVNTNKAARLKFGNKHTVVDGITFDSKKEAEYYGKCKLRVKMGQLLKFDYHVVYELVVNGILICTYEADFVLYHPDGSVTVVDVKGAATESLPIFRIKKALMLAVHGIDVQVV